MYDIEIGICCEIREEVLHEDLGDMSEGIWRNRGLYIYIIIRFCISHRVLLFGYIFLCVN